MRLFAGKDELDLVAALHALSGSGRHRASFVKDKKTP